MPWAILWSIFAKANFFVLELAFQLLSIGLHGAATITYTVKKLAKKYTKECCYVIGSR